MIGFRILVAALFLAVISSSPSLADPVLSVVPASSTVNVGNSISYDINISNVTNLYAYQFDLTFNPAIVSAVSITEGSFLTSFFISGAIDNTRGTIAGNADSLTGPGPGVSGSGTLAVLTLQGVASGSSSINLMNVILLDPSLSPISTSLQSGRVTVNEPSSLSLLLAGMAASILLGLFFRR